MAPPRAEENLRCANWAERVPEEQKRLYVRVFSEARRRKLPFAIGGGFATIAYTGMWRNTKDLDLFILRQDRERFIELFTDLGLADYHTDKPYDRSWIYRGCAGGQIVDAIWEMANHRAAVDEEWLECGSAIVFEGQQCRVIPPEETLWTKLYVVQRERCDWPDALNLIGSVGPDLNWSRLMRRVGEDLPLLGAALSVFAWICPRRALDLPRWIWEQLEIRPPAGGESRVQLFDTRPWMAVEC